MTAVLPQTRASKFRAMRFSVAITLLSLVLASCAASPASSIGPSSAPPAGNPSATPAATPSAVPTASEPDASTASPLAIAWEPSEQFGGQVADVYADGDTWIAGGFDAVDGPAAWTATDAQTWVRSDVENQLPDEIFRGPRLGPMTRLGDSLLSFGTFIGCCDGRGVYGWRSLDGASWTAIESASPLFADGWLVREIAAGDLALVAVETQYAQFAGRLWTWTDATSWVESTPGASDDAASGIELHDVVWSEDRFVAVGARGDAASREPSTATSWVSTDGRTWEESAPGDAEPGVIFLAVAPLPAGGYAALGGVGWMPGSAGATMLAFTSPDGLAWTAAPEPLGAAGSFADLVVVSDGLVALSGKNTWTTRDGIIWADAEPLDGAFLTAAAIGDEIVVFSGGFDSAVWSSQRGVIGE